MKRASNVLWLIAGWLILLVFAGATVAAWWIPIPWLNVGAVVFLTALTLMYLGELLEQTSKSVAWRGWK